MNTEEFDSEMQTDVTYIDINEFTDEAEAFFRRASSGEKIVITDKNKPIYKIPTGHEDVRTLMVEAARPRISPEEYAELLDILEPLD